MARTENDCINTNNTIAQQVWACDDTESRQLVIHDMTTDSGVAFWLDLEGTNVKGVDGNAPKSSDDLWMFSLPDLSMMSPDVPDGCVVQVTLEIYLGKTKSNYAWIE